MVFGKVHAHFRLHRLQIVHEVVVGQNGHDLRFKHGRIVAHSTFGATNGVFACGGPTLTCDWGQDH
jgi:hypothetical protein